MLQPGEALKDQIDRTAAKIAAEKEKKEGMEFCKKLSRDPRFAYCDPENMFYPYFLDTLNHFYKDPDAAKARVQKGSTTNDPAKKDNAAAAIAAREAKVKAQEQSQVNAAVAEASNATVDPLPNVFRLTLQPGQQIPPLEFELMKIAAECSVKWKRVGFEEQLKVRQRDNPLYKFLIPDDPKYMAYQSLKRAYDAVLSTPDEVVEKRLTELTDMNISKAKCLQKALFLKAEVARKKLELLTDAELRKRLCWDRFVVVESFTAETLGLTTTTKSFPAPPGGIPTYQPAMINPTLLSGGTSGQGANPGSRSPPPPQPSVVDSYVVTGHAPQQPQVGFVVQGSGAAPQPLPQFSVDGKARSAAAKPTGDSTSVLASDAEYAKNLGARI